MMTLFRLVNRRLIACIGFAVALVPTAAPQSSGARIAGQIDRDLIRDTVQSLAAVVRREYMDAETAGRVERSLRQGLAADRYARAGSPEDLAAILTRDLFELTRDKHLSVAVVPDRAPGPASGTHPESREAIARRSNFGIQRVEILPGNIGYLNITWFYRPDEARYAITAAMQVLRNADALILDLRDNGGGSPETVALVASYLFDTPGLPLFEITARSGDGGRSYRTEATLLPETDGRRPVYALTSERTFSGGEGLAFILQERKRAEVIGETTAGAANPGRPYPLNAHFEATIPNGNVLSAVRRGKWEGTGVIPEVKTPASEAVRSAQRRALRRFVDGTPGAAHQS
jgi:hypothetical protein